MQTQITLTQSTQLKQNLIDFAEYLNKHVSIGTLSLYINIIIRYIRFVNSEYDNVNITINSVNKSKLNGNLNPQSAQVYINWLTKQKKSPSTIATSGHAIMRFLRWKGMPVELDIPTIRVGEPKYRTLDEVNKIISACRTALERAIITVLFDSAVRISELLNLTLDDIDWNVGTITVIRKGGKRDDVNISSKGVEALKEWLKTRRFQSKRVFGELDYHTVWRIVGKVGNRVGIRGLTPHVFRHSRAIQMLKSGAPIYVVQQHLGHTNIATTMNIYGRFRAADLKDKIPEWSDK